MNPARYRAVKRLFEAASRLPEAERRGFLERECRDDAELLAQVYDLLDRSEVVGDGLGRMLAEPEPAVVPARGIPERIGEYRILGIAGRGGMGTVYEAEQETPRRRVALKVVDLGLADAHVLRRFEVETEVLGRLDHPGIAQIFDAGTFDDGRGPQPFFAMEFIRGKPVTTHVQAHELDIRARIQIVIAIAGAVHHAHQRGIIHRDLKPANILVNEAGQPKILDFGVARVTDADFQTVTLQTSAGQLVGTVPYMSPEQALCEPAALDTRTDIYSLGVLAFELLSGRLPLVLHDCSVQEAMRRLQEDEPIRLGTLDRNLRGDVETIISKSLAREKERRYSSAGELAEDLRRYLAHEPILARPTSATYQLKKFARRNKALVGGVTAGVSIAFLALVVALVFSRGKTRDAEASEERAVLQADRASIAGAAAALELGEATSAAKMLDQVSEERRTWEWNFYRAQLDTSQVGFEVESDPICAGFTADGDVVTLEANGRVCRWSGEDGAMISEVRVPTAGLEGHGWVSHPRTSALDGTCRRLVLREVQTLRVFDTETAELLSEVKLDPTPSFLAMSPDGLRVAAGGQFGAWVWDWPEGRLVKISDLPWRFADFSEDGLLGLHGYGSGQGLLVHDPTDGSTVHTMPNRFRATDLVLLPGGRTTLATVITKVPRMDGGVDRTFVGHRRVTSRIAWSETAQLVASGSLDCGVRLWRLDQEESLSILRGHRDTITNLTFDAEGARVLATAGRAVRIWEVDADRREGILRHDSYVYGVQSLPDGSILSMDFHGDLYLWSADGLLLRKIDLGALRGRLASSEDGRWIVHAGDNGVHLYDEQLRKVAHAQVADPASDVAISVKGDRLAVMTPTRVVLYSTPRLDVLRSMEFEGMPDDAHAKFAGVGLSSDGRLVAAQIEPGTTAIWEVDTGLRLATLKGQPVLITEIEFSPDGQLLATGSVDGSIWVWDHATGATRYRLNEHSDVVYALQFHPDGTRLASGSNDSTVRLWSTEDGTQTALFRKHQDYVFALDFTRDGRRLLTGSGDRTVRMWDTLSSHPR